MPKRGDIREDGMVFWSLAKRCKNGEWWIPAERYKEKTLRDAKNVAQWRRNNPERVMEICKRFREKNRVKISHKRRLNKAYNKKYFDKNKKAILANRMRWIAANGDSVRLSKKNWKKRNPWCAVECFHRRRARIKSTSEPSFETKFLAKLSHAISKGSGVKHHVDHIIPVSKGGAHRWDNLRIVPAIVNLRKGCSISVDVVAHNGGIVGGAIIDA